MLFRSRERMAERDSRGRFIPGTSGNPAGRPKPPSDEVKRALIDNSLESVNVLVRIMKDPNADESNRIKCAITILEKCYGKNFQAIQDNDNSTQQKLDNILEAISMARN